MLWRDAQEVARRTRTLASVAFYRTDIFDLTGESAGPPEALWGLRVSANLFPTLGVQPILGRNILPEEDQPGHPNVMILSFGLGQRRFHGNPAIVGQNVPMSGHSCLAIGVMPQGFNFPLRAADVHTPWPYIEFWAPLKNGGTLEASYSVFVVARRRPEVSLNQAQQDLAAISADLAREFPATNQDHTLHMGLLLDRALGSAKNTLWFLMLASGMFLLIGCANVANFLLARGLHRQHEIGIRVAVGAPGWRIVRQLLTESSVLAVTGGIGGYLPTAVAWKILPVVFPVRVPRLSSARADARILAFSLAVAVIMEFCSESRPRCGLCAVARSRAEARLNIRR
jgi:putative ABC transport system permease protein